MTMSGMSFGFGWIFHMEIVYIGVACLQLLRMYMTGI